MAAALPHRFGKYTLVRRLGVGGMAETFVAKRTLGDVEQLVCLKRVLPAFNQDAEFVRLFQREAKLAGKLRHQNVVGVLDFGNEGGEHYMALELVDGVDLRALLASRPSHKLEAGLVALIALEIAHALDYAHTIRTGGVDGIVHRDVTPSNILLSVHGDVKLADFGVAKSMSGSTAATASGVVKGKVAYMAPEQMRGGDADGRADLFSLGVTMFEALAGRRPFIGSHDVETMMNVIEGRRPRLHELEPDTRPDLAAIVEDLLASDRAQRAPSARALIDRLVACLGPSRDRARLATLVREAYGGSHEPVVARDTALTPVDLADPEAATDTDKDPLPPAAAAPISYAQTDPTKRLGEPSRTARRVMLGGVLGLALAAVAAAAVFVPDSTNTAPSAPPVAATRPLATAPSAPPVAATRPLAAALSPSTTSGAAIGGPPTSPETRDDLPLGAATPPLEEGEPRMASRPSPTHATEARVDVVGMRPASGDVMAARPTTDMRPEPAAMTGEPQPPALAPMAPEPPGEERGRLRVVAVPYGEVWVDDRYMGRSPVTVPVSAGGHRVAVGYERPMVHRQIRLRAGETREVELELPEQ